MIVMIWIYLSHRPLTCRFRFLEDESSVFGLQDENVFKYTVMSPSLRGLMRNSADVKFFSSSHLEKIKQIWLLKIRHYLR